MKLELTDLQSVENYYNVNSLVEETVQQVLKDFSMAGVAIDYLPEFKGEMSAFFDWLDRKILALIEEDQELLMSFLYRVDLSEKKLKETLVSSSVDSSELIAKQVIKREFQKVLLRYIIGGKHLPV
jgi:hypothetical protein